MSQNHLEGRSAAFFCYGDGGGDELDESGRPENPARTPPYFDPVREPFASMRHTHAPLVWQCRYSGIEVPDPLWRYVEFGRDKKYSDNQAEHMASEPDLLREFDEWTDAFADHVAKKGKVKPKRVPRLRLPGTSLSSLADLKTKWRGLRMALGFPIPGTSPAIQQERGLNRTLTISLQEERGRKIAGPVKAIPVRAALSRSIGWGPPNPALLDSICTPQTSTHLLPLCYVVP